MQFYWPVFFLLILGGCTLNDTTGPGVEPGGITEITSMRIEVAEPSGLSLHVNGKSLWVVSDQTARVYQMALDGRTLKTLLYEGQDLEGVCQSKTDLTIWVAEERKREIVQLDSTGQELARFKVAVENRSENSGLEGLALHPLFNTTFVLNEKNPALFVHLADRGIIQSSRPVKYVKDCSGLSIEAAGRFFWLVSDESCRIVKCDSTGAQLSSYPIDVDKAEGIAVSTTDSLIYVVSDSEQKLHIFKMP